MSIHVSVMPREILAALDPQPGGILLDGTLGGGGHTRLLAERVGREGTIIALDRDPRAVAEAEESLKGLPVAVAACSYAEFPAILAELKLTRIDGALFDLGLSSDQLADRERGFSFESEGPLDMRYDPTSGEPAWRMLERMRAEDLANLIFEYGEERASRRVARALVAARATNELRTAAQFAAVIRRAVPPSQDRIDPATRTFQAIRIAVNDELGELKRLLMRLPDYLHPGAKAAFLSFHSLEDRIVKEAFRDDLRWTSASKKPLTAAPDELAANPRSRSAKLRVAERA